MAKDLSGAWDALRQVRQSERLLVAIDSDAGRLQSLIHRYFNQPTREIFLEVERRREALVGSLLTAAFDDALAEQVQKLTDPTEQLRAGFDQLRAVSAAIADTYENEVLGPGKDMSGLYASLDSATRDPAAPIWPALGTSREAFNATLLAANAYYLSIAPQAGEEAMRNIATIERAVPAMLDLAADEAQRQALTKLRERAAALRRGLEMLAEQFTRRDQLFKTDIDDSAARMARVIDGLNTDMNRREDGAQTRFDRTLRDVSIKVLALALVFVVVVVLAGLGIGKSISEPLMDLMRSMHAIVARRNDFVVPGLGERDEIGQMARAVEIFRNNAIAKQRAEEELVASRDRAEAALSDLRETQRSLIEAEKLAALGGLVAGVAHEVNNPVGISLTVASSLSRRCEVFAEELGAGPLRRSRLDEFVRGARQAADQLVANLQRAGELIQSFKQVAVDRSDAERRRFELKEATEQIVASLRPGLKKRRIELSVDVPIGITMDGYPGAYGQIITNLFLNALTHGFVEREAGAIRLEARPHGKRHVAITFEDNGQGMPLEVQQRAFEPFFTARRGRGGTGLGLHIVYNLVTRRLGGSIGLVSEPDSKTVFRLVLPLVAPHEGAAPAAWLAARASP